MPEAATLYPETHLPQPQTSGRARGDIKGKTPFGASWAPLAHVFAITPITPPIGRGAAAATANQKDVT